MNNKEPNLVEELYESRKDMIKVIVGLSLGTVACALFAIVSDWTVFWVCAVCLGACTVMAAKNMRTLNEEINALKYMESVTRDHSWEFPVKEFYDKCRATGITDSNTEFARKKIENIAKSLMTEKAVPETAQGWYIEQAVSFFDIENNRIINETANEERRWKKTLHTASNYYKLENAEKVKNMYGTQKREYLLNYELESTQRLLGDSQAKHFKPALKKEKDWAVHGGIAQGIAGSAAGAVTAMNVMKENEKIREQNAAMMQVASVVNSQRYADEARYRTRIKEYEEELRTLPEKVVFENIPAEEILSAFHISVKEVKRYNERDKGCMNVWLSIKQTRSLHLDIPADAKIVLDGTICGKVYTAEEQPNSECPAGVVVGEFVAPIEMYGIPYQNVLNDGIVLKIESVQGYCNRFYGDINTKYVCVLAETQNLWLMER